MKTTKPNDKMQTANSGQGVCEVCHGTGKRTTKAGQKVECWLCRGTGKASGNMRTK